MGYRVRGFVGRHATATRLRLAFEHARIRTLESELFLLPLSDEWHDAMQETERSQLVQPFWFLSSSIRDKVLDVAGDDPLGYFEADYFGGIGTQSAILWESRQAVVGPVQSAAPGPINLMLQGLGVHLPLPARSTGFVAFVRRFLPARHALLQDEFEIAGLDRYRQMEDWLEAADCGTSSI